MNSILETKTLRAPGADVGEAPGKLTTGFSRERADRYASATANAPAARELEKVRIREALDKLGKHGCNSMLEIGIGQGFATSVLLDYLSPTGTILGVDASNHMQQKIPAESRIRLHVGALDELDLPANSIELSFSLAAFHHVPNKYLTLNEIRRVLVPGANFLIVDVNHDTEAQRTFDYIVREHCSSGHDADFIDEQWIRLLATRSGFEHVSSTIEPAPWMFADENELLAYVRDLFCLEIDRANLKVLVDKYLQPYRDAASGRWMLPWSLGFHLLKKPV